MFETTLKCVQCFLAGRTSQEAKYAVTICSGQALCEDHRPYGRIVPIHPLDFAKMLSDTSNDTIIDVNVRHGASIDGGDLHEIRGVVYRQTPYAPRKEHALPKWEEANGKQPK